MLVRDVNIARFKKINKHVIKHGSILSDSYDESDISSEENENVLIGCYENEPQYIEFELKEMTTTDSGSDRIRLIETLHRYTCEKCVITFSMAFE